MTRTSPQMGPGAPRSDEPLGPRAPRRLRGGDEAGAALVEFSLVFGLFVFVLYGLIAFGMMLALKQSVTHAASDGARAAIGAKPVGTETQNDAYVRVAKAKVASALNWLGPKYNPSSDFTATVGPCGTAECITVRINYPYENRPLVPPAPGLGLLTPSNFGSTAVVQVSG